MARVFRAVDPDELPGILAARLHETPRDAPNSGIALRVALDGPAVADPVGFAAALVAPLRALGRDTAVIAAETFWRDASLRLEYGREDSAEFAGWLDAAALRREVLDPLGPRGSGSFLPSLRDPATNRATREATRAAAPGTVVLVAGELLLGRRLPFERTIHLAMTPGARARRTPAALAWTLAAHDRYDADVAPARHADIVVRLDDPRHPAIG